MSARRSVWWETKCTIRFGDAEFITLSFHLRFNR